MSNEAFEKWMDKEHPSWREWNHICTTAITRLYQEGWQAAEAAMREQLDELGQGQIQLAHELCESQAELVRMREPQMAETCKAVPPHPAACLVEEDMGLVGAGDVEWKGVEGAPRPKKVCLTCEAVKQAVDAALLEAAKHRPRASDLVGWFARCSCSEDCETEQDWIEHIHRLRGVK